MKKAVLIAVIAALMAANSCSKPRDTGSMGPVPAPTCYTGITSADTLGNVISTDPDDWKPNGWLTSMLAYPNPSTGVVTIQFQYTSIPDTATLKFYDCSDAIVGTITATDCPGASNYVFWDGDLMPMGTRLPAGMYRCYITLQSGTTVTAQTYGDIELQ